MSSTDQVTLFHSPQSRSTGVLSLLHELNANYDLKVMSLKRGENRKPEYLAINPMGKVPAIRHAGEMTTEQVAIYIHLADLYPKAGMAPATTDPLRGPYLRWTAFYGSCFEPAVVDRAMKREPAAQGTSPYGTFDQMFGALLAQLEKGPYMLGDKFFALDVLWGTALGWMTMFKIIPENEVITKYIERVKSRPQMKAAQKKDDELQAALDAV